MRICSIEGCSGKHYGNGFCQKHYHRNRKSGSADIDRRTVRRSLSERFWEKVQKTDSCWLWTGYRNGTGYGEISRGGREGAMLAHRASYEINCGPIDNGLHVLHRCDNPRCVRPDHLFLGTHLENMQDMVRKGRGKQLGGGRRGESNGNCRISDDQVREIKRRLAAGEPQAQLARAFNVSKTLIYLIKIGKTRETT
ncbi:HNH endonuclease [Pseudomonas aeruginosa]